jgi:hypothetical protein
MRAEQTLETLCLSNIPKATGTVQYNIGRRRWCKKGMLRFKLLYKELNKMEYSKKYLFLTFNYSSNQLYLVLKKEQHLDRKNGKVKKKV